MSGRLFAVAVVGLLVLGGGLAVLAGVVSLPGSAVSPATTPDPTPSSDAGDSSTPAATLTDTSDPPFGFAVEKIEQCGQTCRDVTTSLSNRQSTAATGVTVETRIYAGNDTSKDPIWTGEESVGDLGAGESYTAVKRVKLGLSDAYAIERNDGWITIETTVQSDSETMTLVERRKVN